MPDKAPVRCQLYYEELTPAVGVSFAIRLIRDDNNDAAIYGIQDARNMPGRTLFYLRANEEGWDEVELVPNVRFEPETHYEFVITEERTGITRIGPFRVPDDPVPAEGFWRLERLLRGYESPPTLTFERGWRLQPTAPTNPTVGAGWLNSTNHELRYWTGTGWVIISAGSSASNIPEITDILSRLEAVEGVNMTQSGEIGANESAIGTNQTTLGDHENRISALENAVPPSDGGGVVPPNNFTGYLFASATNNIVEIPSGRQTVTLNDGSYDRTLTLDVANGEWFVFLIEAAAAPTEITQFGNNVTSEYVSAPVTIDSVTYSAFRHQNNSGTDGTFSLRIRK